MADDLKVTVQRMIDAGESEENIAQVIKHYGDTPDTPLNDVGGTVPGVMAATGAALRATTPLVRPAVKAVGNFMAETKGGLGGAIGGSLGAGIGGGIGSKLGSPFAGASIGAYVGHQAAKKYLTPVVKNAGEYIREMADTAMKRGAGGRFLKYVPSVGGKGLDTLVKTILPGAGEALMVHDGAMIAKPYLDRLGVTDKPPVQMSDDDIIKYIRSRNR